MRSYRNAENEADLSCSHRFLSYVSVIFPQALRNITSCNSYYSKTAAEFLLRRSKSQQYIFIRGKPAVKTFSCVRIPSDSYLFSFLTAVTAVIILNFIIHTAPCTAPRSVLFVIIRFRFIFIFVQLVNNSVQL